MDPIMQGLIGGTITMHSFVIHLLIRERVLSRDTTIEYLEQCLSTASPQARTNLSCFALERVLQNLQVPQPPDGSPPRWTPVVIPGGKT